MYHSLNQSAISCKKWKPSSHVDKDFFFLHWRKLVDTSSVQTMETDLYYDTPDYGYLSRNAILLVSANSLNSSRFLHSCELFPTVNNFDIRFSLLNGSSQEYWFPTRAKPNSVKQKLHMGGGGGLIRPCCHNVAIFCNNSCVDWTKGFSNVVLRKIRKH